jgi:hypothetical protein
MNAGISVELGLWLVEAQQADLKSPLGEMTRPPLHVNAVGVPDHADLDGRLHLTDATTRNAR